MDNAYRRKKEPALNRQLIIQAAIDIGANLDWHQVTFQAIAEKTGLSKGGVIHHFKNKEELLDELLKQSLLELTEWINAYKAQRKTRDGAFGYLQFIMEKGSDEQYRKTMKIVIQAIMISAPYRKIWEAWYKEHILPENGEGMMVHSLIAILVAEGIWYSEQIGFSMISNENKQKIFQHLTAS